MNPENELLKLSEQLAEHNRRKDELVKECGQALYDAFTVYLIERITKAEGQWTLN